MMRTVYIFIVASIMGLSVISCQDSFLNVKPDKKLVIPHTLQDLQSLLDNSDVMNDGMPFMGELGCDDFYMEESRWKRLRPLEKNPYVWAKTIYEDDSFVSDWDFRYRQVYYANLVLEKLEEAGGGETVQAERDNIKGSALFYRAWAFYQLAQLFCKPYNRATAEKDLGIPVRLGSDINAPTTRASVQQSYDRILADLKAAVPLLPVAPLVKTRPSRPAAYALLAKTCLLMGKYGQSLLYADSCLWEYNALMDYNGLDLSGRYSFERFNEEVIFHATITVVAALFNSYHNVDTVLYSSYSEDDLRKTAFYTDNEGAIAFKGTYDGSFSFFSGIATDEVYLIRAECHARNGETKKSLNDLNLLLKKRFKAGTLVPITATGPEDALRKVLRERRKELVFRGIRWSDLRRLNSDARFAKTLYRELDGQVYELEPNDPRYVLPVPNKVIELSGIEQNLR